MDESSALITNSLDMLVVLDQEGRYLQAGGAVQAVLGYRPEEMLGRMYSDFIVPEDREISIAVNAVLRDRNNGKDSVHDFVVRCLHKDGSVIPMSWSARWAEDRKLLYAAGRKLSERYRAQAELQKAKDRLSAILESIGDAFFAVDQNWRITYVNQKTASFVGRAVEDLAGKILWRAVPEVLASPVMAFYRQAMQTRETNFFDVHWEPNQTWIEVRVYPHEDGISVFFHDISARREAERAIRESEQRFREVIEMTPAGYLLADAAGTIMNVNPALCHISGYDKDELLGQDIARLFVRYPGDDALVERGGPTSIHGREAVLVHKRGHLVHMLANASIRRDGRGDALSFTAFLTDITQRKQTEARLEYLATRDTLTGLPNRAFLNERLQQALDKATGSAALAVMFIDLDRFKEVNDSMGHDPGDILLRQVAHRLSGNTRPDDLVARLGGDEFVVVAACSAGNASAAKIAEKLLAALAAPFDIAGQEVFVGASIGISMFPQDGTTKETLFQNADTAMYRAKAAGRNGYRFFEPQMSVEAKTRMTLEHALRRALERNEFELHYQPRVDLKSMTMVGMEALLRWNHPRFGQIPPLQFIPIAEERGFIEAIGDWVLREACLQTRRWVDVLGRPLRVSVNLSARQLRLQDLPAQVEAALRATHLPPHLLELELTETALMEDMEASERVFAALKRLGIMLAVDDFGTGYSGLAYLQRFPLDTLKLDRAFLTQHNKARNPRFIKAFVDLAHTLDLSVVAEGIEDEETLSFLRDCECDEGQGYLFSRPLAAGEFAARLAGPPDEGK